MEDRFSSKRLIWTILKGKLNILDVLASKGISLGGDCVLCGDNWDTNSSFIQPMWPVYSFYSLAKG